MKKIEEREYYPVKIQIDGQTVFCIWYGMENEDRLISTNDRLTIFTSMDEVIEFSKHQKLTLNLDHELAYYNLDTPFEELYSEDMLSFWNIFSDIANSINVSFRGDVMGEFRDNAYDKLCNEVIWKEGKKVFLKEEVTVIYELWKEGKEMLRREFKK